MNAATIGSATRPAISLDERQALPDTAATSFVLAGGTLLYVGHCL